MPQQDMRWDVFMRILDSLPKEPHVVSLQGEGEPTMHPQFWEMVTEVSARGLETTTITNGYLVDVERIASTLNSVAISIDTLDAEEAERIGRYKLPKVLETLHQLLALMEAKRIRVMTVYYGQYLNDLATYLKSLGITHIIQPLQSKEDYAQRYPQLVTLPPIQKIAHGCRFLEHDTMRFFNIHGTMLPCCFIKDAREFQSVATLKTQLAAGDIPSCCRGCRELTALRKC